MQFKYIDEQEARALAEAGVPVWNRYRNADRDSPWDHDWSEWYDISDWEQDDWNFAKIEWEEEYRVEVE